MQHATNRRMNKPTKEAFRETGASPLLFSRRAHLLTTGTGQRWYPSLRSGRALCEADCALCGERQTMPPSLRASVVIACAAGRRLPPHLHLCSKSLSPSGATCHPPAKTCHCTRHALRVRQLSRRDGRCHPAPSIFFCMRQKKQKRLPAGSRKDVIHYGDLSPGSKGHKPWGGPLRLRGFRLSELFRHLQRL